MKYRYFIYYLRNKSRFNLFAWLIRVANKRPYNHIEVAAIPEGLVLPPRFYGSVYPESRMATAKYIESKYIFIKMQELENFNNFSDESNIRWLDLMCGKKYSALQIIMQTISAMSVLMKRLLSKVILNHDDLLICVELGARFMVERMGYAKCKSFDAWQFADIENAKAGR
jgi:hypothetical protein